MKSLIILGISGSIGRQTVELVRKNPEKFNLIGASVQNSISYINDLILQFSSLVYVCVGKEEDAISLKQRYPHLHFFFGEQGLIELVNISTSALVVNALVGFVGLKPTIAAIQSGKNIALANKESLVCAGDIIRHELNKHNVRLFPIDSEHSALLQCIKGEDIHQIKNLIITGSGGPFRDLSLNELRYVTKEQALHHPNWKMGDKITIDSATLVNKGLEIIEAHQLFNMDYDHIKVVMHYESIIHGMVEFMDGSIKASLGSPSMAIPILYAINDGMHDVASSVTFSLDQMFSLRFKPFDFKRFEAIELAYYVGKTGGTAPTVFNASNEVAVQAFLQNEIRFIDIVAIIKFVINEHQTIISPTLDDIINTDHWAREKARMKIQALKEGQSC